MYQLIRRETLRMGQSRTARFEGQDHGSGVSFFLVDNEPGQGPGQHVHPYSETWIVRAGKAEFDVGGEKLAACAGDVVVVGANVPHGFRNVGEDRLDIICVHASDRIIQEWL
ncbi:cupin domain-containing protein [Mesorhizobium sp. ANAO-SY3R2]|uniref:cupin domain-containing protein n=1 Tax=Mesorhizobium sp. ANAO-SY3R2 TaxID=3166644 RepID=UPI0036726B64